MDFLSLFTGKLGFYLLLVTVCLVASCAMLKRCDRMINPPEPRVKTLGPYKVLDVPNGATIIGIKRGSGVRDRQQVTVNLQYVQAPVSGPDADLAKAHLAEIAGEQITVQYEKHGIFRGTAQDSQRRLDEECEATAEAPATVSREMTDEEFEKMKAELYGPRKDCKICGGTGVDVMDGDRMAQAYFAMWFEPHRHNCKVCKVDGEMFTLCPKAQEAWEKCKSEFADFEPIKQKCLCVGTYIEDRSGWDIEKVEADLEARGPLTGIVFGFSGIDCNLNMINHGYADCTADAPKQYRVARDLAKKNKEGIWGKAK